MKIAFNKKFRQNKILVTGALAFVLLHGAGSAVAADNSSHTALPSLNTSVPNPSLPPAPMLGTPGMPVDMPKPTAALPNPSIMPAQDTTLPPPPRLEKAGKTFDAVDIKTPESVKDVVRKLSAVDNVTLEDLNSARQAVAKIDALIEIEKKITELDKLRQEHEGSGSKPLASAIPASAINALPTPVMPSFPSANPPPNNNFANNQAAMPVAMNSSSEINRIIGAAGRYSAIIKSGDQLKTVSVGDRLDGGTVTSISSTGVMVEQGKTSHTIHVKNIDSVFGSSH